jgi:formylglycine-generating enzyme required for sulfatase activity
MLTALAVLHWNEKRLPEQRAELYESILRWLARAREDRPGRAKPERCLELLRRLALAMFKADGGRKVQVSRRWAAEQLAALKGFDTLASAERFLEEEELDSGILVRRGQEIRFWHLSFQEYLAARAIADLDDAEQHSLLLAPPRHFYQPEWREVVLLLAGVLHGQGKEKVDGVVDAVLEKLIVRVSLVDQARATALLVGMVRDLAPFNYQPKNEQAYQVLLEATLGIFDAYKAAAVPFKLRLEAAEALGETGDPRLADESLYWVDITGGSFWMGAQNINPQVPSFDPEAYDNEAPPHAVEVESFRLGRWPVTVQEFTDFIEDEGYDVEHWWRAGGFKQQQEPERWKEQESHRNRPVTGVSWFEAMAFCAWRTEHLKIMGRLEPGRVIRLPTEAEWEWAARGAEIRKGSPGKTSLSHYPWGNHQCVERLLNYARDIGCPTPVGVYPEGASPEGALDLAGNVWEWCQDWYGETYYVQCQQQGCVQSPRGPTRGSHRVMRGGSWYSDPRSTRAAYRDFYDLRHVTIGFRLVCAFPLPEP